LLQTPGAKLHLYGKSEARPGRKMGHATFLADDLAQALRDVSAYRQTVGLDPIADL
jgi:5-(carboxyamino)imidazole ribonucleotide synthase